MVELINQSLVTPYRERDRFTGLALVIENDLGDQSDVPRKKPSRFLGPNPVEQEARAYVAAGVEVTQREYFRRKLVVAADATHSMHGTINDCADRDCGL